jgi:hypothetical protein
MALVRYSTASIRGPPPEEPSMAANPRENARVQVRC